MTQAELGVAPEPLESDLQELREWRRMPRFIPRIPISSIFADKRVSILQLSETGMRIQHSEAFRLGTEGKILFVVIAASVSYSVKVRVVWSRLAKTATKHGDRVFQSGLMVVEGQLTLRHALRNLHSSRELRPERRAITRRTPERLDPEPEEKQLNISSDEITIVRCALDTLRKNPLTAADCYTRARALLSEEPVRKVVPATQRDREDVMSAWQYLDRSIDLGKVSAIIRILKSLRAIPPAPEPAAVPDVAPPPAAPAPPEEILSERELRIREAVLRLL